MQRIVNPYLSTNAAWQICELANLRAAEKYNFVWELQETKMGKLTTTSHPFLPIFQAKFHRVFAWSWLQLNSSATAPLPIYSEHTQKRHWTCSELEHCFYFLQVPWLFLPRQASALGPALFPSQGPRTKALPMLRSYASYKRRNGRETLFWDKSRLKKRRGTSMEQQTSVISRRILQQCH